MQGSTEAAISARWRWLIAAVIAAIWMGTLDYRTLIKTDEGRYAEIAREMAASGDWVTPRLNGIKYFEKPPLQYWATAAAFEVFGENEWTARLWPASTSLLGVLLAGLVGRRLFGPQAGWVSALALASAFLYFGMGHLNTLDMGLSFFLHAALAGFLLAQTADSRRAGLRWMLVTWTSLGLAVLSKGLVALVLAGATLVAYSLAARDFSPWRRLALAPGLPLLLLVTAPWFVAVSLANPEFPRFFFIHEHFERFLTRAHGRYEPWWYFVPIFLAGALPWTTISIQAYAGAWRLPKAEGFDAPRFLATWIAVVFLFFSASGSKLPSYILPVFPALAWLIGAHSLRAGGRAVAVHALLMAALPVAALVALPLAIDRQADGATPRGMVADYARWVQTACALMAAGALAAAWLAWRRDTHRALIALGLAGLISAALIVLGHESLARSNSARHLALQVRPLLAPDTPFYSVGTYDQTLTYYLGRTVTLVAYRDEMDFGLRQEPHLWIPTVAEFATRWRAHAKAFAVMTPETFDQLAREGLPMRVEARDTRRVIVRTP